MSLVPKLYTPLDLREAKSIITFEQVFISIVEGTYR